MFTTIVTIAVLVAVVIGVARLGGLRSFSDVRNAFSKNLADARTRRESEVRASTK
ncbi:TPA: hypothetical protein QDB01_000401 [Burkholderia vietnamiensis]|nr:hypothetical protein [Burkholderia vietnamiensis]